MCRKLGEIHLKRDMMNQHHFQLQNMLVDCCRLVEDQQIHMKREPVLTHMKMVLVLTHR